MNTVDRIKQFIDAKGISKRQFYQLTGLSNGYLDKARAIGSGNIEKIYSAFPDLNIKWLITGKGDMITKPQQQPMVANEPSEQARYYKGNPDVVTVDMHQQPVIPMLDQKAAAGYPAFLENKRQYIEELPVMQIQRYPFNQGELICLQVDGDSMEPTIMRNDYVIARKLLSIDELKEGYVHLVVTDDAVNCKRLYRQGKSKLQLVSDNSTYTDYFERTADVRELYKVLAKLSTDLASKTNEWERNIENRLQLLETRLLEQKGDKS